MAKDWSYLKWLQSWRDQGSPRAPKQPYLVIVAWKDACAHETDLDSGLLTGLCCGFVVKADEEELKTCREVFEDQTTRDFMTVPAKTVTSMYPLGVVRLWGKVA